MRFFIKLGHEPQTIIILIESMMTKTSKAAWHQDTQREEWEKNGHIGEVPFYFHKSSSSVDGIVRVGFCLLWEGVVGLLHTIWGISTSLSLIKTPTTHYCTAKARKQERKEKNKNEIFIDVKNPNSGKIKCKERSIPLQSPPNTFLPQKVLVLVGWVGESCWDFEPLPLFFSPPPSCPCKDWEIAFFVKWILCVVLWLWLCLCHM